MTNQASSSTSSWRCRRRARTPSSPWVRPRASYVARHKETNDNTTTTTTITTTTTTNNDNNNNNTNTNTNNDIHGQAKWVKSRMLLHGRAMIFPLYDLHKLPPLRRQVFSGATMISDTLFLTMICEYELYLVNYDI